MPNQSDLDGFWGEAATTPPSNLAEEAKKLEMLLGQAVKKVKHGELVVCGRPEHASQTIPVGWEMAQCLRCRITRRVLAAQTPGFIPKKYPRKKSAAPAHWDEPLQALDDPNQIPVPEFVDDDDIIDEDEGDGGVEGNG